MTIIASSKINDECKVKVENDAYSTSLLATRNGYQWSGMEINEEMAIQIIETLSVYLKKEAQKRTKDLT